MFGYVRICKEGLSAAEFERFRAYYCGLCKAIGRISDSARLSLSYDMTFLAVLLSAITPEEDKAVLCRCMIHPLKKRQRIEDNRILNYVAGISILLAYRKCEDDIRDERSPKAIAGFITHRNAFLKIRKEFSDYDKKIGAHLKRLSELEKENSQDCDITADCFAKICEVIFTPDFIDDSNTKAALSWLGYNIGRWIYLIDAFDDLEKDLGKAYNPFSGRIKNPETDIPLLAKDLELTLTYTLSNISAAYDMLDIQRNGEILKNILYPGLYGMQKKVLKLQEVNDGSL